MNSEKAEALPISSEISVWIVEDNEPLRETIVELIVQTDGFECTYATDSCEKALDALKSGNVPQIILMDLGLPGMSGEEGIRLIKARSPATQIIVLTIYEDDDRVFNAICAGASGYLLKPSSSGKIIDALRSVLLGGSPMNALIARKVLSMFTQFVRPETDYGLSEREREILGCIVDGATQNQIAEKLFLSPHTVNTHFRNIYAKLHVHSRSGAVAKAIKDGLIRW